MNRLWLRASLLLTCLVPLLLAADSCGAADRGAGEKLFPKETLVFMTIPNVPEFKTKWDKTSVGQLLHDPQLQPFLEDVHGKINEFSKKIEEEVGVSLNDLLELPQGELTLAIVEQPPQKFAVVLLMDYKEQETVDKLLKKMDDGLQDKAEHSTEDVENVQLHIYSLKSSGDNPVTSLVYFADKSCLVFSNEVEAAKSVLERWEGNSDETLAQSESFSYIQTQCKLESGEPLMKMFINPIGLINTGISVAQTQFPQAGMAIGFLPMLGIDAMKGWGGVVEFDEGEYEAIANFYSYCDSSKGLMGLFNFPAIQLAPPKWVPSTVGSFAAINWNVQGAYTAVETLVDSFQGRGATARFLDQRASEGPMIHLKKDLLDHLDGKINIIQSLKAESDDGPPTPDIMFSLGLKDAAKMKKTLAAVAKSADANMETRDFNGETIYEVDQPGSDGVISIAIAEGQLFFTNDTPLLEGILRGKSGQRAALVDSPEYKRIAKYFPAKESMLSFQRSDAQLKIYYNLLKNADEDTIEGIDTSKLPPFEAIAKYFQPSGGYTVPDKKGVKSVSFTLKRAD